MGWECGSFEQKLLRRAWKFRTIHRSPLQSQVLAQTQRTSLESPPEGQGSQLQPLGGSPVGRTRWGFTGMRKLPGPQSLPPHQSRRVWNSPLVPASRIPGRGHATCRSHPDFFKAPVGKCKLSKDPRQAERPFDSQQQNIPGRGKTRPHLEWRSWGCRGEEGAREDWRVAATDLGGYQQESGFCSEGEGQPWQGPGPGWGCRRLSPPAVWTRLAALRVQSQLGGYCGHPWCER